MAEFFDLCEALFNGDFPKILELLRNGTDINCRDSFGRTVLHHIAQNCLQGEVILDTVIPNLVSLGANINARDITGMTPLHYALCPCNDVLAEAFKADYEERWQTVMPSGAEARERELNDAIERMQIRAVESLAKLGADINTKFELGVNSIHRAIQAKNTRCLELLVSLGVDLNVRKCVGYTALNLAISQRKSAITERLIELGADTNSSYSAIKPIHQAVETGILDKVRVLVEYDADVGAARWDNLTPIFQAFEIARGSEMLEHLVKLGCDLNAKVSQRSIVCEAIKSEKVVILKYLVNTRPALIKPGSCMGQVKETVLGISVGERDYKTVELLLQNGADVNIGFDFVPQLVFALRLGQMEMLKALVKLGVDIDHLIYTANRTSLYQALVTDQPEMLRLLLRHGGDVNQVYNAAENLIHLAVARNDKNVVRVLAELGADLDVEKYEAMNLLHYALQNSCSMDMVKVLVEEGIDLNHGYNERVTALHDAVRQGNTVMVRILGDHKADMNYGRLEGLTPLHKAVYEGRCDVIRYFASRGADMNVRCLFSVKPLHDAVRLGNGNIVRSLVASGAGIDPDRGHMTLLYWAVYYETTEALKCLLECGTNVNETSYFNITPLFDAVDRSDLTMVRTLANLGAAEYICRREETALSQCIEKDMYSASETLLKYGADKNIRDSRVSPFDVAIQHDYCCVAVPSRLDVRYQEELSLLHRACELGLTDLARLLIIMENNVDSADPPGCPKPLEYLPFVDIADYHVLIEASTAETVTEKVNEEFVSIAGIPKMTAALHTPGVGDVRYILKPSSKEISERAYKLLDAATKRKKTATGKPFHMKAIGSASEGTRVGLPNEMDILFEMPTGEDEMTAPVDLGNGYVKYGYVAQRFRYFQDRDEALGALVCGQDPSRGVRGSAGFHYETGIGYFNLQTSPCTDEKVTIVKRDTYIHPDDRKACTILVLRWDDGHTKFRIPVDLVPSLHIDDWPEGAVTKTWLMDEQELRNRGYVLVPKPPHVHSELAKDHTEDQLQTLWKISFPHLETEHMQRLEQRIKDVYLTAKFLRNPDVCRIMISDNDSLPRNVDKYVTSYLLKMCFFKNVEYFRKTDLSLEEMVCKVYSDLEEGLAQGFIPLFFLPKVSALSGIKLDVSKSTKVARVMLRFARSLCLRDCKNDQRTHFKDEDEEVIVYQREPKSVYKVYRI